MGYRFRAPGWAVPSTTAQPFTECIAADLRERKIAHAHRMDVGLAAVHTMSAGIASQYASHSTAADHGAYWQGA